MKIIDTISVNPGKTTLGHTESGTSIFRNPVLGVESDSKPADFTKVLFPSAGAGVKEFKKYATGLRTLFATILIITGLALLSTTAVIHSTVLAICSLCFGGILALGLLTRPVMLGAAVFYCIMGALSIRAGVTDVTVFSLMFGCLIFSTIGSGKYSCDEILRHAILRHRKQSIRKRKEDMMGYRAFHHVRF